LVSSETNKRNSTFEKVENYFPPANPVDGEGRIKKDHGLGYSESYIVVIDCVGPCLIERTGIIKLIDINFDSFGHVFDYLFTGPALIRRDCSYVFKFLIVI
jgi:hypothetical protein